MTEERPEPTDADVDDVTPETTAATDSDVTDATDLTEDDADDGDNADDGDDVDTTEADDVDGDEPETDENDEDAPDAAAADGRTPASVTAATAAPQAADSPFARVVRGLRHPRLTGAGVVISLLVGLLGFALIAQVQSNSNTSALTSDRPEDLVRILSELDFRKDRLDTEITSLQTQQQQLNSGAAGRQAALNAATQRADELGILAGTLPAVGPGLVIRIGPPSSGTLSSIVVLETIEELRGAGAEAIEISGTNSPTVRVIASTWFGDGEGGVTVGGILLPGTLTITAIGDSQTMQTALSIPGGVADTVEGNGGTVLLQQETRVQVTTLAPSGTLKYAHPVS
jgi:uncharacterized protein YlxW (UPF0749 family)